MNGIMQIIGKLFYNFASRFLANIKFAPQYSSPTELWGADINTEKEYYRNANTRAEDIGIIKRAGIVKSNTALRYPARSSVSYWGSNENIMLPYTPDFFKSIAYNVLLENYSLVIDEFKEDTYPQDQPGADYNLNEHYNYRVLPTKEAKTYEEIQNYINYLNTTMFYPDKSDVVGFQGYTDWRLPTPKELYMILQMEKQADQEPDDSSSSSYSSGSSYSSSADYLDVEENEWEKMWHAEANNLKSKIDDYKNGRRYYATDYTQNNYVYLWGIAGRQHIDDTFAIAYTNISSNSKMLYRIVRSDTRQIVPDDPTPETESESITLPTNDVYINLEQPLNETRAPIDEKFNEIVIIHSKGSYKDVGNMESLFEDNGWQLPSETQMLALMNDFNNNPDLYSSAQQLINNLSSPYVWLKNNWDTTPYMVFDLQNRNVTYINQSVDEYYTIIFMRYTSDPKLIKEYIVDQNTIDFDPDIFGYNEGDVITNLDIILTYDFAIYNSNFNRIRTSTAHTIQDYPNDSKGWQPIPVQSIIDTTSIHRRIYDLENLFKNDFALSIAKTCENEFDYRKFNTYSGDGTVVIYNYNLSGEFAQEIGLSNIDYYSRYVALAKKYIPEDNPSHEIDYGSHTLPLNDVYINLEQPLNETRAPIDEKFNEIAIIHTTGSYEVVGNMEFLFNSYGWQLPSFDQIISLLNDFNNNPNLYSNAQQLISNLSTPYIWLKNDWNASTFSVFDMQNNTVTYIAPDPNITCAIILVRYSSNPKLVSEYVANSSNVDFDMNYGYEEGDVITNLDIILTYDLLNSNNAFNKIRTGSKCTTYTYPNNSRGWNTIPYETMDEKHSIIRRIYDLEKIFKHDFSLSIAKTCENEFDYREFNVTSNQNPVVVHYNYNLNGEIMGANPGDPENSLYYSRYVAYYVVSNR